MTRYKVLLVCHNHPDLLVGGVELYTRDLYEALRDSPRVEPVLLARAGRPYTESASLHPESPIAMANRDPNEYLLYTEFGDFDHFFGRLSDHTPLTRHFDRFLRDLQPDVVHFQHTAYLGYDIVRITRNALPRAPIVYSLHEYLPICHRDGQMVRVQNGELCREESPRRCHECFPGITPQQFFLRKRFVQSQFSLVDRFVAPSEYVKERYVRWGLEPDKINVEQQGIPQAQVTAEKFEERRPRTVRPRNRFGYFGQLNPYKGADTLLHAIDLLGADFEGHLWVYGANLEKQSPEWQQRFGELTETPRPTVTFGDSYQRSDLAALMARIDWVVVPSAWWETGPMVVWEAFQHKRPVICSDIGGQSEKVVDGVNGLHFRRGDPESLAHAMEQAAETPGLWEELRSGIPERPGHPMEQHAAALTATYEQLLGGRLRSSKKPVPEQAKRRSRSKANGRTSAQLVGE
jgi:glycosyltransferase involved in cell wall biosynthesis